MTVTSTVALTRDPAVVDAFNSRQGLETRDSTDFEVRCMSHTFSSCD